MQGLLALLPILLILVLMVGRGWSAAAAGTCGLAVTVATAIAAFGYGTSVQTGPGTAHAIGGALAEAAFVAATVLWIVFPALCILELQNRSGAFDVLKIGLERLTGDPRIAAILVGWFFALFMEGAAGFGTPVALAAPILVSLGFAPLQAVTLVLIGHAAGVSFGAVGTPIFPQMAVTGFTGLELARNTALLHALLGSMLLVFVFAIAGRAVGPSTARNWRQWGWVALAAPCFLVPFLTVATFVGPELPTLAGALIGGGLFVAILRRRRRSTPATANAGDGPLGAALWRSSLPYLVLLLLILASRLVGPLRRTLQDVSWEWTLFETFSGSIQPFYHPGTMLLCGFVVGGLMQRRRMAELATAAGHAARRVAPVVVALVAMLGISRVMVHAGMIASLADAAADSLGPVWPLVVPAVGVLGSFVTGSATASNILLTNFQEATARTLGLPVLQLVSGQGFGAAVGNIVCPHNVIAGAATVGLQGREGEVLRRTALACACYTVAGGAVLYVLISWT